ncbi:MAG TPA: YkgJ family cysteine cluster protein [Patescibacteria group bacterium]|nr:YkgJ family cysteine cluster protein [Patescibacteria group bacterium]
MNGELPDCMSCGLCCRKPVGPPAPYPEDLERWAAEGTPEIGHRLGGCREAVCPFLVIGPGFRCVIYLTRPLVCRHFAAGGSACLELRLKSFGDVRELGTSWNPET